MKAKIALAAFAAMMAACLPAKAEWINGPFRKWAVEQGIEGVKFS